MRTHPIICVAPADLTLPPSIDVQEAVRIEQARAAALLDFDVWIDRIFCMSLFPEKPKSNLSNEARANYVAYLRITMAMQQLATVEILDCVKHPKRKGIVDALAVWADKALAAAEIT